MFGAIGSGMSWMMDNAKGVGSMTGGLSGLTNAIVNHIVAEKTQGRGIPQGAQIGPQKAADMSGLSGGLSQKEINKAADELLEKSGNSHITDAAQNSKDARQQADAKAVQQESREMVQAQFKLKEAYAKVEPDKKSTDKNLNSLYRKLEKKQKDKVELSSAEKSFMKEAKATNKQVQVFKKSILDYNKKYNAKSNTKPKANPDMAYAGRGRPIAEG